MTENDIESLWHFHNTTADETSQIIECIQDEDTHKAALAAHMWDCMNNLVLLEILKRVDRDKKLDTSALFARSSYVRN